MRNVIILNDSTFITGKVMVPTFTVRTKYGDLQFESSVVSYIEYRSPANDGRDELFDIEGSSFYGSVLPETIQVRVNAQTIEIPKADIRFIVLFSGRNESVSEETKAMVDALNT